MSAPTWHPIDSAPTDGRSILVYDPSIGIIIARWRDGGWLTAAASGMADVVPTHWMALPPRPRW
ncbi:MAG: hypothetical protein P4M00_16330 [Azospirillaceae bacterium]|nr:hypothetical protein [Azospirillaceae bacterium]